MTKEAMTILEAMVHAMDGKLVRPVRWLKWDQALKLDWDGRLWCWGMESSGNWKCEGVWETPYASDLTGDWEVVTE